MNNESPIFRSLAMIEEKIQEKLTVESLADSVHFSKYYYQRMFRETVGDSVMRYVTRRRLSLAAEELAGEGANVLEIALRYGYDSHEGFTRSFRAHIGVTPTEYRKYHQFILSPKMWKEGEHMLYSKTTDEMIRELNGLIVRTKETAAYTRKNKGIVPGASFFEEFWEFTADRADAVAEGLTQTLGSITAIAERPDEISARFVIVKAIEDAVFWSDITAFQTGLTVSRAKPEYREAFRPICGAYDKLAQDAHLKAGKIVCFFRELAEMIFSDMRKNVRQKVGEIVEKGRKVVEVLSENLPDPYTYISEEIRAITEEIAAASLEDMTIRLLEDVLFRLDIVLFAADVDALRVSSCKPLFDNILEFREQIDGAVELFRSLPEDSGQISASPERRPVPDRVAEKRYRDAAFQGKILLFYLKGEIQKLGGLQPEEKHRTALDAVSGKFDKAVRLAQCAAEEADASAIRERFQEVYDDMMLEAEGLGIYGAPLQYIAEEIGRMVSHL